MPDITTPDEIEFVGDIPRPDASANRTGALPAFREALQARPGEWAIHPKVGTYRGALATIAARLRAEGFEAAQRTQEDGTYRLYARLPKDAA